MEDNVSILHVIEKFWNGGASLGTLAAIRYSMLNNRFKHSILSLLPPEGDIIREAQDLGIRVLYSPCSLQRDSYVKSADIIQVEWWNNPAINEFLNSLCDPIRLIIWIRVNCSSSAHYFPKEFLGIADHIMLCSQSIYDSHTIKTLDEGVKKNKVSLLFAGADFEKLIPNFQKKVQKDKFIVGYIGTVDFIKMHPNYIAMSSSINVPNIKFSICGDGTLEELKEQARQMQAEDKFDFVGYVKDVALHLKSFDVFGYPLDRETYAASEKSLQEAMYMGIPPVVFPYGGVRDLVQNGSTGIVVNTETEYKEAIEYLYHNPDIRLILSKNAHEYASINFGAHKQTKLLHSIYRSVLKIAKNIKSSQFSLTSDVEINNSHIEGAKKFLYSLAVAEREIFLENISENNIVWNFRSDIKISQVSKQLLYTLNKYISFYPHDPYLIFWLGLVYLNKENFSESLILLNKAKSLGLKIPRVNLYISILLFMSELNSENMKKSVPSSVVAKRSMSNIFFEFIYIFIKHLSTQEEENGN